MTDLNIVKQKAAELKANIETLLTNFRRETGYTPQITIATKSQPTNSGTVTHQKVNVELTVA